MVSKIEGTVAVASGTAERASATTQRRMRLSVEEVPATEDQADTGGGCDCDFCTLNCV
ncbi:hypothetical protein OID55_41665 (plasmid) [Streptomyces sp. NBC_00715]|uniref:hypothetical protein n=1 Tax=Streptomyces sp. NBC_00715 TaxID=2975811 RepID=UPI002F91326F